MLGREYGKISVRCKRQIAKALLSLGRPITVTLVPEYLLIVKDKASAKLCRPVKSVCVAKDKSQKLEEIQVSHTVRGAYPHHTLCNAPPHVQL